MDVTELLNGIDAFKRRLASMAGLQDQREFGSSDADVTGAIGSVMPGVTDSALRELGGVVARNADDASTTLGALSGVQGAGVLPLKLIHPLGDAPLIGLADRAGATPFMPAREAAADYMQRAGLMHNPPVDYVKADPDRGARIAQAFDEMPHDPTDPKVRASYDAMINETLAQYDAAKRAGLKVDFIRGADPYGNPRNAIRDVTENNHLFVYPTEQGFGGSASSHVDISGNPLLAPTDEFISGQRATANDIFRAVHDYFGHVKEGVGFRAAGEENAWQQHRAMYSPQARPAMTTETRGQNSWVNFGPHGAANRTASAGETQYAPQKTGLLPDWVQNEGVAQPLFWIPRP